MSTSRNGITNLLLLLDETEHAYVVGIEQRGGIQAAKISKDYIKIIKYNQFFS